MLSFLISLVNLNAENYFKIGTNPVIVPFGFYDLSFDVAYFKKFSSGVIYLQQFAGMYPKEQERNYYNLELNTRFFLNSFDKKGFYLKLGYDKNFTSLKEHTSEIERNGNQAIYRLLGLIGYQFVGNSNKSYNGFTLFGAGFSKVVGKEKNIKYGSFEDNELGILDSDFKIEFFTGIMF
jgi:hypothetical protein